MNTLNRAGVTWGVVLTAAAILLACGSYEPAVGPSALGGHCKNALPLIEGDGFRGVVLPSDTSRKALKLNRPDVEDTFRASDDTVRELEAGMREAVRSRRRDASQQAASPARDKDVERLTRIEADLGKTLRQYSGVVVGGARRILVNAFPDDNYCYRDEFVSVPDGGAQFWRVQYDLSLSQFVHWEVNPD
jgi:hypothetical protein